MTVLPAIPRAAVLVETVALIFSSTACIPSGASDVAPEILSPMVSVQAFISGGITLPIIFERSRAHASIFSPHFCTVSIDPDHGRRVSSLASISA